MGERNAHCWPLQNPKIVTDNPLHPQQVNLWCALSGIPVFEPMFVEGTVGSQVYVHIVEMLRLI
jgi:hypothetical protein